MTSFAAMRAISLQARNDRRPLGLLIHRAIKQNRPAEMVPPNYNGRLPDSRSLKLRLPHLENQPTYPRVALSQALICSRLGRAEVMARLITYLCLSHIIHLISDHAVRHHIHNSHTQHTPTKSTLISLIFYRSYTTYYVIYMRDIDNAFTVIF